ncbi:hypothetical protein [Leifsonia sp. AG29]|uniref:hypothetical protein n=1 Tax=Leifsonia sp. AG29 TaxID=2598860 RepID=UPI00131D6845|nr:hypothetical protein [Leifsonia sp. AG29]
MWIRRSLLAVALYALFVLALGTVYIVAQHDGRSSAEDAPRALLSSARSTGGTGAVDAAGQPRRRDLAHDQGVFWIRYDSSNQPTAGNGLLHGSLAVVPPGVLDSARERGQDAVTWQPEPGLRFAIVAQPTTHGGVVIAGQSLQRTELRAEQTLLYVMLALLGGLAVVVAWVVVDWLVSRPRPWPDRAGRA